MLRPCWLCFLSLISIVINNPPFSLQGMVHPNPGRQSEPLGCGDRPPALGSSGQDCLLIRVSKVHQRAPPMFLCPREILRQVAMNLRCDLGHVT